MTSFDILNPHQTMAFWQKRGGKDMYLCTFFSSTRNFDIYYNQLIKLSIRIDLVTRQLKITMRLSERQPCIKYCTLSRVGMDARPINVDIHVEIGICFICIPKVRYWNNIFVSYFYYHCKVTMVTSNYLRWSCHFHKESFGYPRWNCLFNEEKTYFSQIKR